MRNNTVHNKHCYVNFQIKTRHSVIIVTKPRILSNMIVHKRMIEKILFKYGKRMYFKNALLQQVSIENIIYNIKMK